ARWRGRLAACGERAAGYEGADHRNPGFGHTCDPGPRQQISEAHLPYHRVHRVLMRGFDVRLQIPLFNFGEVRVRQAVVTYMQPVNRVLDLKVTGSAMLGVGQLGSRWVFVLALTIGVAGRSRDRSVCGQSRSVRWGYWPAVMGWGRWGKSWGGLAAC